MTYSCIILKNTYAIESKTSPLFLEYQNDIERIKKDQRYKILFVGAPQYQRPIVSTKAIEELSEKVQAQYEYQELYQGAYEEKNVQEILGSGKVLSHDPKRKAYIWKRDGIGSYVYNLGVSFKKLNDIKQVSQNEGYLISCVDPEPREKYQLLTKSCIGDFKMTLKDLANPDELKTIYDLIVVDFHTIGFLKPEEIKSSMRLLKKEGIFLAASNDKQINDIEKMTKLAVIGVGIQKQHNPPIIAVQAKNNRYSPSDYIRAPQDSYYIFQKNS